MIKLSKDINPSYQLYWRNDPEVYTTCRQPILLSPQENEAYWERVAQDRSIEMFAICDVNGKWITVGTCGLTSIDYIHRKAEYSLLIAREYWGKGYATAALNELLRISFEELNMACIWGEIFADNLAGIRIAEKLGFKKEGTLRSRYFKKGKRIDTIMVSILGDEWLTVKGLQAYVAAAKS